MDIQQLTQLNHSPSRNRIAAVAVLACVLAGAWSSLAPTTASAGSERGSGALNHLSTSLTAPATVSAGGPTTFVGYDYLVVLGAGAGETVRRFSISGGDTNPYAVAVSVPNSRDTCIASGDVECTFRSVAPGTRRSARFRTRVNTRNLPATVTFAPVMTATIDAPSFTGMTGGPAIIVQRTTRLVAGARVVMGAGTNNVTGTGIANTFYGGAGNDRLNGAGGPDKLHGQAGDDVIMCGAGADMAYGGVGDDMLRCSDGSPGDRIDGGAGSDTCLGDQGDTFVSCEKTTVAARGPS